ncbi:chromodomain-helicase-DNA-binding protein 8-like, partial [Chamaea fasciata]|uniref:chromodomain-helicase-DNA-binding protein 8-like n=1 Tax=Chamaea fasciata TaxID=190680 RepID=UPI00336AE4DB
QNLLYWPKERALIRRLELLCRAVLRAGEGPEAAPPPRPAPAPPRPRRQEGKEFTVRIKEDEGLKLTFQKHRLGPNGAARPAAAGKKNSKKLVELELRCLEGLRGEPEGVVGTPNPARAEPEFPEPRLLPFVEQRREKWHRKKVRNRRKMAQ